MHHLLRGGRRAGEGDLVQAGPAQCVAGRAESGDQLQHRRFGYHLRERVDQPGADAGSVLTGLADHRVAGGQGVGDGAERGEHRVVPWPDHADDAEGLVLDRRGVVAHQQAGRGPPRAEHLAGVLGRPRDVLDREHDLQLRVRMRLAGLGVDQLGQLADAAGEHARPGGQPPGAFGEGQRRPEAGRGPGPRHRGVDRRGVMHGVAADDLAGRRVERVEGDLARALGDQ